MSTAIDLLPYVFVLLYTCANLTVVFLYSKVTLSLSNSLRHGKSRDMFALILNVGISRRWVVNFTPWLLYHCVGTLVPISYEVWLAPEIVLIVRRREKSFDPNRSWTTDLLPLALQPTVGFGLLNNVLPFFPICHQLSPSSHSQHLKISFYFLFPSFTGSSPSLSSLPVLEWRSFWASSPTIFSLGDLTSLSCALISILLYFLLYSSLLVLHSLDFPILRFHI